MALRRGFVRYAFSIQYHGSSFLGFANLKDQENAILPNGTDLRGYRSIEGRLREALEDMLGSKDQFDHIQVSSRTDRGVHALKNTCQVDILQRDGQISWKPEVLLRGLNHHLSQQGAGDLLPFSSNDNDINDHKPPLSNKERKERLIQRRAKRKLDQWSFHYPMNELRILNLLQAPLTIKNHYNEIDPSQPPEVEWNIRFSAKQRTYIYRILACPRDVADWAVPFEWDRSWRVVPLKNHASDHTPHILDIQAMKKAAACFLGTHDFSSFRAAGCQRKLPIVTMHNIQVATQPYGEPLLWEATGGLLGLGGGSDNNSKETSALQQPHLITIKIVGSSFVYNQVRNMVGALVAVGRGSLDPLEIKRILEVRDRTQAPSLAPAHGLFLANVKHDDIVL